MTIHLGLTFWCAVIALLLIIGLMFVSFSVDKKYKTKHDLINGAVVIIAIALMWLGAFQVVRWIAGRF